MKDLHDSHLQYNSLSWESLNNFSMDGKRLKTSTVKQENIFSNKIPFMSVVKILIIYSKLLLIY